MFFSKNLKHLRKKRHKLTQEKLARDLNLTRSVISSYEDGRAEPSIATLNNISEYFDISVDHLTSIDLSLTDYKALEVQRALERYTSARNLKVFSTQVNISDSRIVPLVPQKAAAGYTTGFADVDYLNDLPKYNLPFLSRGKKLRAFEITGDSMLPLQSGTIVIGEYVEDLNEIKDGSMYIVVSKNDGVVFKKVYDKIHEKSCLLLQSSNILYSPYEINVDEVIELWKYSAHIGRSFPVEYDPTDSFAQALERMEFEIQDMKGRSKR